MAKPAKKKVTTKVEEFTGDGFEIEGGTPEPTDFDVSMEAVEDAETLQKVLSQYEVSAVTFKVLKVTPTGDEFCYKTNDRVDEEYIQRNFGGGDYKVRIFINETFKKTIPLKISARKFDEPEAKANPGGNADSHTQFLQQMVLALIARPAPAGGSGPGITELVTALAGIDQLRGNKDAPPLDIFTKGIEFAQSLNGERDWKSELLSTVKDVVKPALPHLIPAIMGGGPVTNGNPNAQSITPQSQPTLPSPNPQEQQKAIILQGIQYLKKKAISGVPPELIVEWVATNAEEYSQFIHIVLNTPFDTFAEHDSELRTEPFQSWFVAVYDGLRSAFAPPDPMADDPGGESGNVVDIGKNGVTGKGRGK